jgi:spore coat protein U-like protein
MVDTSNGGNSMPAMHSRGERKMRILTGLGILTGLACIGPAGATTTQSNFAVQLTITTQCVINSTATLNFGSSGVITANIDQSTTVAVQCTNTTPFDIGLDAGVNGGTTTTRKLKNTLSAATVNYTLWQDSGRSTTNWGDTVGTDTMTLTGDGASHTYTVYGRIPAQTTPVAGSYADTVIVTVTY